MRELGPALSSASQSQIRAIVAGNVKIVVNEFNNSLIIQGTEADIQFILETVKQLDVLPRQVFIEVQIYSVELRDDLSYGVGWFLQQRGAGLPTGGEDGGTVEIGPATVGSISGGALSAVTRIAIGNERQLQLVVQALRDKTNVEVVEAPRILALDGTAASINVGAEVPVTSASFGNPLTSGTTNFVNSIQFRPTGTTLLIVPRISASGIVTMDLVLEVSQASGPALTPTINRNYIQTSLIVRDGQTVGLGGIISDSESSGKKRVPVLGDIPILGALFGETTRNERRFELIVFITPNVIRSLPTAAELTLEFKRSLRASYDFIQRKQTEDELLRKQRREQELQNQ
jgi:general secretion pathway protein D